MAVARSSQLFAATLFLPCQPAPASCVLIVAVSLHMIYCKGKCMCPAAGAADRRQCSTGSGSGRFLPVSGHLAATKRKFVYFVKTVARRLGFRLAACKPGPGRRLLLTFPGQAKHSRMLLSILVCLFLLLLSLGCMAKFSAKPRQITSFYTGQIVCCVFCPDSAINYAGKFFPVPHSLAVYACAIFACLGMVQGSALAWPRPQGHDSRAKGGKDSRTERKLMCLPPSAALLLGEG